MVMSSIAAVCSIRNSKLNNTMEQQLCVTCGLELQMEDQEQEQENGMFPKFHKTCIVCYTCMAPLGDNKWCFMHKGVPYCDVTCLQSKRQPKDSNCFGCKGQLTGNSRVIKVRGHVYHQRCLRCAECDKLFKPSSSYRIKNKNIVCPAHAVHKKKCILNRTQITEIQRLSLLRRYRQCKYPNSLVRAKIAKDLDLPAAVVKVWYQNCRARTKKLRK